MEFSTTNNRVNLRLQSASSAPVSPKEQLGFLWQRHQSLSTVFKCTLGLGRRGLGLMASFVSAENGFASCCGTSATTLQTSNNMFILIVVFAHCSRASACGDLRNADMASFSGQPGFWKTVVPRWINSTAYGTLHWSTWLLEDCRPPLDSFNEADRPPAGKNADLFHQRFVSAAWTQQTRINSSVAATRRRHRGVGFPPPLTGSAERLMLCLGKGTKRRSRTPSGRPPALCFSSCQALFLPHPYPPASVPFARPRVPQAARAGAHLCKCVAGAHTRRRAPCGVPPQPIHNPVAHVSPRGAWESTHAKLL